MSRNQLARTPDNKIGQTVGFVVLKADRWGGWDETPAVMMDTISQAAGMAQRYAGDDPKGTYAVARLNLVMIDRPAQDPT
jgi:hypothetical protein